MRNDKEVIGRDYISSLIKRESHIAEGLPGEITNETK